MKQKDDEKPCGTCDGWGYVRYEWAMSKVAEAINSPVGDWSPALAWSIYQSSGIAEAHWLSLHLAARADGSAAVHADVAYLLTVPEDLQFDVEVGLTRVPWLDDAEWRRLRRAQRAAEAVLFSFIMECPLLNALRSAASGATELMVAPTPQTSQAPRPLVDGPMSNKHREQKLINAMFEVAFAMYQCGLNAYMKIPSAEDHEENAAFVRRQLAALGFNVEPCGASWGVLK